MPLARASEPNDPWFRYQWPLASRGCEEGIGIAAAWQRLGWPNRAPGARRRPVIALVDTGINAAASDCRGRNPAHAVERVQRELAGAVARNEDVADCQGHGTAMASIIGANGDNGEGIAGVVWPLDLRSCQAAPGAAADPARVAACLAWVSDLARSGTRVAAVNVSSQDSKPHPGTEHAVRELREHGVLVVAAAGDDYDVDNDTAVDRRSYPASYELSNVISVAGVDPQGRRYMSRRGKRTVHVAAPGRDIPALDAATPEMRIVHGTSPAAAHVTGLIALLAAEDPSRDWRALRNLVLAGGVPIAGLENETVTGRRICAAGDGGLGSMTCRDQRVLRRIRPVQDAVTIRAGETVELEVLSIVCARSADPGSVEITDTRTGGIVSVADLLHDEGAEPDEVSRDGHWRGRWTPPAPGEWELRSAASPADVLRVLVQP